MYWDANNLYGWGMSQYLAIGDYCWLRPSPDQSFARVYEDDNGYGCEDALTSYFTREAILALKHDEYKAACSR